MRITNKTTVRKIKTADYVPMQIRTDGECQATEYYYIRKGDSSLLELAFNSMDAVIQRITLIICEEYYKLMEPYCIPYNNMNGDVLIETNGETYSQIFRCEIYPNAVKIVVSDAESHVCISSENVIWELNDRGDLVSLCMLDPTGIASEHCFKELESNRR